MQPSHFMEPTTAELVQEVERIEGKSFVFQKKRVSDVEIEFTHEQENFEEIMEDFYLLNPAELYVCPHCYTHYLSTRFIPNIPHHAKWEKHIAEGVT